MNRPQLACKEDAPPWSTGLVGMSHALALCVSATPILWENNQGKPPHIDGSLLRNPPLLGAFVPPVT